MGALRVAWHRSPPHGSTPKSIPRNAIADLASSTRIARRTSAEALEPRGAAEAPRRKSQDMKVAASVSASVDRVTGMFLA